MFRKANNKKSRIYTPRNVIIAKFLSMYAFIHSVVRLVSHRLLRTVSADAEAGHIKHVESLPIGRVRAQDGTHLA